MTALTPETKRARDWRRLHWLGNGRKLAKRGLEVTLVEKAPHVLPPLDEEMAAFVKAELSKTMFK